MNLQTLANYLPHLPQMLEQPLLWDSLIINKRKPHTYRVFTRIGDIRICLHHFEQCTPDESFIHPHSWPMAVLVLEGSYQMNLGTSDDKETFPKTMGSSVVIQAGSRYEITDPLTWHSVTPTNNTGVWTVMVNGPNFAQPHKRVRTTQGKDLLKMTATELQVFLNTFKGKLEGFT
jgi:hypothetical protein